MITVTPNILEVEIIDGVAVVTVTPSPINVTVEKGNVTITGNSEQVSGEFPNGVINGSNATFTTDYNFVPESVLFFRNGVAQYNPTHYTTSGTLTIILNFSPIVGDVLQVNYIKS